MKRTGVLFFQQCFKQGNLIAEACEESFDEGVTIVSLLKDCSRTKDLCRGTKLHRAIISKGLFRKNPYVGSTLVSMYAKCGALAVAQRVLEELPNRSLVSWNALIVGYAEQGQNEKAFSCFQLMQRDGFMPNAVSFICILKACANMRDLDKGKEVHREILKHSLLRKDCVVLANALVNMYSKCGAMATARELLDELNVKDEISWNGLIAGYVQHGQVKEALQSFKQMQLEGLFPDAITYISSLMICARTLDIDKGKQMHTVINSTGFLKENIKLCTALVDMYAKCGALLKAEEVFDSLTVRNVVSWSALIAGYAQQGEYKRALTCSGRMKREGIAPDATTYVSLLKACGNSEALEEGKQIHKEIIKRNLLGKHIELDTALLDMYAKCGEMKEAREILEGLQARNVVCWSAVVGGYGRLGNGKLAFQSFDQMQCEGVSPNIITYVCILKACVSVRCIHKGKQIHAMIVHEGLLGKDALLGTTLVDMYAKCGALAKAQEVLGELPSRKSASWNVIIAEFAQQAQGKEALGCLEQMESDGIFPDAVTYICILMACGRTANYDKGREIHYEIVRNGLLIKDIRLANALVDMYTRSGALQNALQVIDDMPYRDTVSWNTIITGYVEEGLVDEAFVCFDQMQWEGVSPDVITFICILKACGKVGTVERGRQLHHQIITQFLLDENILLGTTLVDMYSKCGAVEEAQLVFDELSSPNTVSWNTLIAGYALQGQGKEALRCFEQAQHNSILPNRITFISVVNACCHSGLVDEGEMYLLDMNREQGLMSNVDHGICMIDLFGRSGQFQKAMSVIKQLPLQDCSLTWGALLGACQKWSNLNLGRLAFDRLLQLDASHTAAYVLMAKLCAAAGMEDDSA